jgi:hypothetical protein
VILNKSYNIVNILANTSGSRGMVISVIFMVSIDLRYVVQSGIKYQSSVSDI